MLFDTLNPKIIIAFKSEEYESYALREPYIFIIAFEFTIFILIIPYHI
jgi:hypothetical protein